MALTVVWVVNNLSLKPALTKPYISLSSSVKFKSVNFLDLRIWLSIVRLALADALSNLKLDANLAPMASV